MRLSITIIQSVLALAFVSGCVPGGIAADDETRGTGEATDSFGDTGTDDFGDGDGDGDGMSPWAEIRCVDSVTEICYGRLNSSADAWTIVVQDCYLEQLIESGVATPANAWTAESCNPGDYPSGLLPEHRCLTLLDREITVCYAGDGDWWTQVVPDCEIAPGPVSAWPSWQCGGSAGMIGAHPWDTVGCFEGQSTSCIAVKLDDAMLAWPTCYVDQFTAIPIPECSVSSGNMWEPCPTNPLTGEPAPCQGEDLACVPADFGEANICLPLGGCPTPTPDYGTGYELGWGDACYPRCVTDSDCDVGQVCGYAVSDGQPMCAWPRDPTPCAGSLGCECLPGNQCAENLECVDGICTSCPNGQIGCPCAGGQCDTGLTCVDNVCQ